MNTLEIIQLTVTSGGFCLSGIACCLNLVLVFNVFCIKNYKKSFDLQLIYCRFAVDSVYTFLTFLNMLSILRKRFDPDYLFFGNKDALFFISVPNFNMGSIRALLVLLISIDRVSATCFPIFYRNNRGRISNFLVLTLIVIFVLSFEYSMLFGYCDYVLDIPVGCMAFSCVVNQCYYNYWLSSDQILYFSTGCLSILLCSRLYLWTKKEHKRNKDLVRANRIALLDIFMVFTFDLLPAFLLKYLYAIFGNIGPMSAMSKNFGFVIEGCIICKILILSRRSTVSDGNLFASTASVQRST